MKRRRNLKPYNPHSVCPKCKGTRVRTFYEPPIEDDLFWYERKYSPPDFWPETEFMRRICGRCGFEWPETTAYVSASQSLAGDPEEEKP